MQEFIEQYLMVAAYLRFQNTVLHKEKLVKFNTNHVYKTLSAKHGAVRPA